jgi:prepilin-type N-terminal cleavage/methylation domain-containing protein
MKPISRIATNPRRPVRDGVTLIELMVALAITLIMMTAVITLFANLSGTVSDSRALIEISERLRATRNRLQLDLAGHTASTIPPLRPEDGEGYLEIIEGPNTDAWSAFYNAAGATTQLSGNSVPNAANNQLIEYSGFANPSLGAPAYSTTNDIMGDTDDVLMLTVRSQGEPFVGWGAYTYTNPMNGATTVTRALMESPTAEVIWYAVPNGRSIPTAASPSGAVSPPIQLFTLYRRVLLVAPQLVPVSSVGKVYSFNPTAPASIPSFYNQFDLSVRSGPGPSGSVVAVGNSLTDLTNRQNRFLHAFSLSTNGGILLSNFSNWPSVSPPTAPMTHSSFPFPIQNPSTAVNSAGNWTLTSLLLAVPAGLNNGTGLLAVNGTPPNQRLGEDVILTDVLAFDIRVFDPTAPLVTVGASSTDVLVPSDPGYLPVGGGGTAVGYGGFVDLGYSDSIASTAPTVVPFNASPSATSASYFSAFPNAISLSTVSQAGQFQTNGQTMLRTYDTFSLGYEQDLIDQDEGGNGIVDQGADGLDDDPPSTVSGGVTHATPDGIVDNVPQITTPYLSSNNTLTPPTSVIPGSVTAGERETMAPYPFPLRGVQITLRVYEPDTRQVRQITVVQDFLPN